MTAEWLEHGGALHAAREAFPRAPLPWIDLSTGINPHAWDTARAGPIDWTRLPERAAIDELLAAAADHLGIDPARLCATPGSEIALRLLAHLGLPGPFRHVAPGYRTHGEAFPDGRAIPLDALSGEADKGGTILLANPGNPDGHILATDELRRIAGRIAAAGGCLVVDEAFADVHPDIGLAPCLNGDEPVLILRSFGKFFGLAGVRLGFVVGPPPWIAAFRRHVGSWPVSAAAIAIGGAAYRDRPWIAATRARLAGEADALDALLRRHGLRAAGDCPLFRLVGTDDAARLFERLARHGILTRPFDYDPRRLRIGLPGSGDALARLDRALADG